MANSERLSNSEILLRFGKKVRTVSQEAMELTYEHVIRGANLGRKGKLRTWEDTADDERAQFGILFERTLKNLLGAQKLPKRLGLDVFYKGEAFDVKVRTMVPSKDISLSPKQNASLVIAALYDMENRKFQIHMGYPDQHGSTPLNFSGKHTLAGGNIKTMPKLAEGFFA